MKRIIIADDSSMARMFVRRCLDIVGCAEAEYAEAADGKEVLEILKDRPADLVVTDLNMPEMNGLDLLKRIKASPRLNETPILVITSAANPERVQELEKWGAMAVLSKPISPATLAPVLAGFLGEEEDAD